MVPWEYWRVYVFDVLFWGDHKLKCCHMCTRLRLQRVQEEMRMCTVTRITSSSSNKINSALAAGAEPWW